jgi:hypothetical protein
MPIISYINECKAFCQYANEERLSDNEVVLWHALFNLFNLRAISNCWPEGFIPLTNAKVLSMTPWGSGNSAVEKLRRTRDKLIQRGLIAYEAGERRKRAPMYQMKYFCPVDKSVDNSVDNIVFTPQNMVNREGNREGKREGNGEDIKYKDLDYNPDLKKTHINHQQQEGRARDGPAKWRDNIKPMAGGYRKANGTVGPCRFDDGWKNSDKARGAIAGRLIKAFKGEKDVSFFWEQLRDLMEEGMPPEVIEDELPNFDHASRLLSRLNKLYYELGLDAQWRKREGKEA